MQNNITHNFLGTTKKSKKSNDCMKNIHDLKLENSPENGGL